jgi:MFS family permease
MTTGERKIAAAERPVPHPRGSFLGPFGYRDFSLLWSGLLIGNIGTWMQFSGLGYYVATLAPNGGVASFYIGLLGASRMIPVLLASPFAGVVADRYPRRQILLSTNIMTAVLAVLLALAIFTDSATLPVVLIISAFQAATQSFDAPARQSWVTLMVPRELVGNAIGLNSFAFNAPSVIGPPLAGLLITASGNSVAPCMILNAIVKFAVVAAIIFMKPSAASSTQRTPFVEAFLEGVRYIAGHLALRWVFIMLIVSALSVRSYSFLLPAYGVHVIHTNALQLGYLQAASGIGAVGGALVIAAATVRRRSLIWFVAAVVASLGVASLGLTNAFPVAAVLLVIVGLGTQAYISTSNVLVQTLAPDEMRGRAVSIYSMIMLGLVPGGALVIGTLARFLDLSTVFVGSGLLCAVLACWTYITHPKLRAV